MRRRIRVLVGLALTIAAVPVALFGLLLLLWQGDGGSGDPYFDYRDIRVNAKLVGGFLLLVASAAVAVAIWLVRRDERA